MVFDSKQDRRITRTKEAIERAFLDLFSTRPFEQITINEIAELANVNRGTVYLHYADKYDLLDRCIEGHLSRMFSLCMADRDDNDQIDLIGSLLPMFGYIQEHFAFFATMLNNPKTTLFREHMMRAAVANIEAKLERQEAVPGAERQVTVYFIASALYGVVEWWIVQDKPLAPSDMADCLWKLFERFRLMSAD